MLNCKGKKIQEYPPLTFKKKLEDRKVEIEGLLSLCLECKYDHICEWSLLECVRIYGV